MPTLPENSVDSIITDPPYGLDFMGKSWDHGVPAIEFWQAALRVAKPGAILMAFGGTRTFHRLACAIEDAGWELRDTMCWLYGSGFPKSLDISKAIDKAAGAEREVVGESTTLLQQQDHPHSFAGGWKDKSEEGKRVLVTAPATPVAHLWQGYGTALKPAWEPIIIAMKPLEGTYAENAQKWGVAGLWIDGGRIGGIGGVRKVNIKPDSGGFNGEGFGCDGDLEPVGGRWPANLLLEQTLVPVLTLDNNCDIMALEVIKQYYGDLHKVSAMWQRVPDIPELCEAGQEVLFEGLLRPMDQGKSTETDGRQAPHGGSQRENAAGAKTGRPQGEELSILQGTLDESGVLVHSPVRIDRASAGNCSADVSETSTGRVNAPIGNGNELESAPVEGGNCPSQERSQDGQSDRESATDEPNGTYQDVHHVGGGEQAFEVLARDVPECWRKYFKRTGYSIVDPTSSARLLDEQSGISKSSGVINRWTDGAKPFGGGAGHLYESVQGVADSGGASRFFYTSKASSSERNAGLEDMEEVDANKWNAGGIGERRRQAGQGMSRNTHPTVKPVDLMRYLCKLTRTPTGGVVLDPFMGSGTTGIACILEHRDFIGIEIDEKYTEIARKRISDMEGPLFAVTPEVKHGEPYLYN
jgi:DNA modification methylase